MNTTYDLNAPKRATNLSINSDLLKKAKSHQINLSKSFESYLAQLVKEYELRAWQNENREAIEEYNAHIDREGVFSDGLRSF
ncbi:MAG: type II toxin-antitoxin system CcdA family antitoxin [Campylobacterota bacterium]|nr:type II toxin-antitoxin system CcdA family antitoxin [Campylobacterota bacterium]